MERVIHVVEPTLEDSSGHCLSFVECFCRAGRGTGYKLRVWGGKKAGQPDCPGADVTLERYFSRRIRRVQAFLLYRRLLSMPGRIFLPTAGRSDLVLFHHASRGTIPPGKVFLYFHWFRVSPGRRDFLKRMAGRQPNVTIIGSTETVAAPFRECGFPNVDVAPIPVAETGAAVSPGGKPFTHFLFAGAARQDKGFPRIVDLVVLLSARGEEIPVTVQVSPDHYGKQDPAISSDIARLRAARYPGLQLVERPPDMAEFRKLFEGAVCLQPYDRKEFADRVSGVTLDALTAGCPVVATSGTWMARAVERFGAGKTVDDPTAEQLLSAASEVIADYGSYRRNAAEAGRVLLEENSARHLFAAVTA